MTQSVAMASVFAYVRGWHCTITFLQLPQKFFSPSDII